MEFLTITIVNIIWILYSMSEGIRESFFDYYQKFNKRRCLFEVKKMFLIQRFIVLTLTTIVTSYSLGMLSLLIALGQICMFKYFHKILYDLGYKKLNYEVENNELKIFKKMNKSKNFLLLLGVSIQIFIYIFIL
jgi:hypothetical protein